MANKENSSIEGIVVGMTAEDFYRDTRKLDYLYSQLGSGNNNLSNIVYSHLGKNHIEYAFTSEKKIPFISSIVDVAESLGLTHGMKFVDSVSVKMNHYFYVTNDIKGNLSMFTKYREDTFISSETLKGLISNGYNIEFDGILIVVTLVQSKGIKEDLESFKALADKFPNGFHK